MNIEFLAGETKPVTMDGNWIHVEASQGDLVFQFETGETVSLKETAVYDRNKPIGRVLITSVLGGLVGIGYGHGTYTPPVKGQQVQVSTMPKIEIEAGQSVGVDALPKVEIAAGQSVAVESLPKVEIEAGQSVAVQSLPKVEIESGQSVAVQSMPKVEIEAGQSLAVQSLPKVEIESGQSVAVEVSAQLVTGEIDTFPATIALNATRKKIILKANTINVDLVKVGAFELEAGEFVELETTAEINLTAVTAGDKIQYIEV
ncbi:hypothetical protein ST37_01735 (plasmid) [Vibrio sp. qd031]|uniref:hypothetical protein n=1 Tax=Vibrio sp. qd031 TaxID=1603038 RepID=UPI000A100B81|nr:hypothetical protein [Vibrio sp. qd031]ORT52517.1 hypothetical protein ST37_01735 [Vibrio sp. qd031]